MVDFIRFLQLDTLKNELAELEAKGKDLEHLLTTPDTVARMAQIRQELQRRENATTEQKFKPFDPMLTRTFESELKALKQDPPKHIYPVTPEEVKARIEYLENELGHNTGKDWHDNVPWPPDGSQYEDPF